VCVISKTHAQCANFNAHLAQNLSQVRAITADHWANAFVRRGRCPFDCVVIEEASMLDANLWNEVAKASLLVKQWVVLADWNQFGAIGNTYCGSPVEVEVEDSDLLWGLTQGCRWVPTENKRSDPVLFEFIQGLVNGISEQTGMSSEIFHSGLVNGISGQPDLASELFHSGLVSGISEQTGMSSEIFHSGLVNGRSGQAGTPS
jgi:hypothetical protein